MNPQLGKTIVQKRMGETFLQSERSLSDNPTTDHVEWKRQGRLDSVAWEEESSFDVLSKRIIATTEEGRRKCRRIFAVAASKLHTDYRDERRFDPPSLLLLSGRAKVRAAAAASLLPPPGPRAQPDTDDARPQDASMIMRCGWAKC